MTCRESEPSALAQGWGPNAAGSPAPLQERVCGLAEAPAAQGTGPGLAVGPLTAIQVLAVVVLVEDCRTRAWSFRSCSSNDLQQSRKRGEHSRSPGPGQPPPIPPGPVVPACLANRLGLFCTSRWCCPAGAQDHRGPRCPCQVLTLGTHMFCFCSSCTFFCSSWFCTVQATTLPAGRGHKTAHQPDQTWGLSSAPGG